jgi:hypothetical protein
MITNLLATVTFLLTTNVTTTPSDYYSERGTSPGIAWFTESRPHAKDERIEVVLPEVATFEFSGRRHSVTNAKTLSVTTKRLRQEWVEDKALKPDENMVDFSRLGYGPTNGIIWATNAAGLAITNNKQNQ